MIKRTSFIEKIRQYICIDLIKVISGMRRCGKSVIVEQLRDEITSAIDPGAPFVYLNLEDDRNARFLEKGVLHDYVTDILDKNPERKVYVFLDEIHEVAEWERAVNSLRTRKNADIYITGSNSKLLSGELATYLTGRYVEFKVTPFSFAEFVEASRGVFCNLDVGGLFEEYLEQGGLPFLCNIGYDRKLSHGYLEDVFGSILLKDVVRRNGIRDVDLLDRVVRYVMTEAGHVFSARSIVRFLKHENRGTTVDTILNHLKACEQAFLIRKVPRQDLIGKRILAVDEKYYVEDCGLRRAIVHGNLQDDIDQMLENVVYHELCRRGWTVTVGRVKAKEVDFVCDRGSERMYVQVTYLMPTKETREREFGALLAIPDQFPKMVLSLDRLNLGGNGILHKYIPEFLLETEEKEL